MLELSFVAVLQAVLLEAAKLPEFSAVEKWVFFGHSMVSHPLKI